VEGFEHGGRGRTAQCDSFAALSTALLVFWNTRLLRRAARTTAALFLAGTGFAILALGEHYFIDIVAAFPFSLLFQAVFSRVEPHWRRSAAVSTVLLAVWLGRAALVAAGGCSVARGGGNGICSDGGGICLDGAVSDLHWQQSGIHSKLWGCSDITRPSPIDPGDSWREVFLPERPV
jgi:hypothetical protein